MKPSGNNRWQKRKDKKNQQVASFKVSNGEARRGNHSWWNDDSSGISPLNRPDLQPGKQRHFSSWDGMKSDQLSSGQVSRGHGIGSKGASNGQGHSSTANLNFPNTVVRGRLKYNFGFMRSDEILNSVQSQKAITKHRWIPSRQPKQQHQQQRQQWRPEKNVQQISDSPSSNIVTVSIANESSNINNSDVVVVLGKKSKKRIKRRVSEQSIIGDDDEYYEPETNSLCSLVSRTVCVAPMDEDEVDIPECDVIVV